jgi:hypothetical protein
MNQNPTASNAGMASPQVDETEVDSKLYSYFLRGGWWGNRDSSGDYVPPPPQSSDASTDGLDFDDTTSVISTTDTASELDWESDRGDEEPLDDGQRTPTQRSPGPVSFASAVASARASRESTPLLDTPIAAADLARLLNPRSPEDREEARALAAHLTSDGIMTRSRFRQQLQRQRAQVLLTNKHAVAAHHHNHHHHSAGGGGGGGGGQFPAPLPEKMTPEEEARVLEQLLLSRRAAAQSSSHQPPSSTPPSSSPPLSSGDGTSATAAAAANLSWATGAAGLGPDGPQCVVCQSAPRTIIVWPCRCLSLCDDCRVSLAMNNFDKCVCCRREVISFSRIYVP